jgi:CubicO group peptidase (beta-lactamase class C family)
MRFLAGYSPTILLLLCGFSSVFAQSDIHKINRLNSFIERGMADWEIPGLAISVVKNGKTICQRGFGLKNLNAEDSVDNHSIFGICSTTKAMTALTLAMLVEEQKLKWDDPVIQYLPDFKLSSDSWTNQVRVRDLLTHNAGLPNLDFLWYAHTLELREMMERLQYVPQAYPIRGGYSYQNVMYAIAGALVEVISGVPWTTFLQKRVFDPLDMKESFPTYQASLSFQNRMTPHFRISEKIVTIPPMNIDRVAPAGAVWSSVHDMAKWMHFLLNKGKVNGVSLISEKNYAELFNPQTIIPQKDFYPTTRLTSPTWTTYGLGWFQQEYRGKALHFHTGSIDGDIAILGLLPADSLGVFVLGNLDHAEFRHAIMFEVLDLFGNFQNQESRDWHTEIKDLYRQQADKDRMESVPDNINREKINLKPFVGTYRHPLYGKIEFKEIADEKGLLYLTPLLSLMLTPLNEQEFKGKYQDYFWFDDEKIKFELSAKGNRVKALIMGNRKWFKEK